MLSKLGSELTINVRSEPSFVRSEPSFVRSEPSFFNFDFRGIYKYSFLIIFLSCNQFMTHYAININVHGLYGQLDGKRSL